MKRNFLIYPGAHKQMEFFPVTIENENSIIRCRWEEYYSTKNNFEYYYIETEEFVIDENDIFLFDFHLTEMKIICKYLALFSEAE